MTKKKTIDVIKNQFKNVSEQTGLIHELWDLFFHASVLELWYLQKIDPKNTSAELGRILYYNSMRSVVELLFKFIKDRQTTLSIPNLCDAYGITNPIDSQVIEFIGETRGNRVGHNISFDPATYFREIHKTSKLDVGVAVNECCDFYCKLIQDTMHIEYHFKETAKLYATRHFTAVCKEFNNELVKLTE